MVLFILPLENRQCKRTGADEGSHLPWNHHSHRAHWRVGLHLTKGQDISRHTVAAPRIPSALPVWEDKAAVVTFSFGAHIPNEITFPGAPSLAVFLHMAAFWWYTLCAPFGPTGHTDNPRPQHCSSGPDKFLVKGVSQFTNCKRQRRNHSAENTTAGHSSR